MSSVHDFLHIFVILISFVNGQLDNNDIENYTTNITGAVKEVATEFPIIQIKLEAFMFWPRGIVPFYIESTHFDPDQDLEIRRTLSDFEVKTCIKFRIVPARPLGNEHVLVFQNPHGVKKCVLNTEPHSIEEPHKVTVGYDCMHSPFIERIVMRALGFPFEHNRMTRDLHVQVLPENVEPGYVELFTKDLMWPEELRSVPYDINSVMHFGEREYTKNGHRTIIFKNTTSLPKHNGLTSKDLKKIRIVYQDECSLREDEKRKADCWNYAKPPNRRKRSPIDVDTPKSLRVNPNITPPPEPNNDLHKGVKTAENPAPEPVKLENIPVINAKAKSQVYTDGLVKELGIETEVEDLIEQVHKIAAVALQKARNKYCNQSKTILRSEPEQVVMEKPKDVNLLGLIHDTASYANSLVDKAVGNLTEFCEKSKSIDDYQRQACPFFDKSRCRQSYKSTKSGPVKYSTQHRPLIRQSTKHEGYVSKNIYEKWYRSGNHTEEPVHNAATETTANREKRHANVTGQPIDKEVLNAKVTKSHLRMGTRIKLDKKHVFAPNYRASNLTDEGLTKSRRKRNSDYDRPSEEDKRNFEHQRVRAQKWTNPRARGEYERNWDASRVSMERNRKAKDHRMREDSEPEQMDYTVRETTKKRLRKIPRDNAPPKSSLRTVALNKKNLEFYNERKWPDNIVRYFIQDNNGEFDIDDVRNRIAEVNAILREKTCVNLEEIKEEDFEKYEDFLVLDNSPDYVTGRVGGKQSFGVVELLKGGQHRQHTAMMVMAMLGFYFEVSRHDRDKYIRVHNRHVRPDKLHHFEKIREDATFDLPYDFKSATHPAWQFWRQLGRTGISTVATFKERDPDGSLMKSLGQNSELLSELDIVKINSVYGINCFIKKGKRTKKVKNKEQSDSRGERDENEGDNGDENGDEMTSPAYDE